MCSSLPPPSSSPVDTAVDGGDSGNSGNSDSVSNNVNATLQQSTVQDFIPIDGMRTITDETALTMIARMQGTPVQTSLHPEPIVTTHVSSPSSPLSSSSSSSSIKDDIENSNNDQLAFVFLHGFDSSLLEFRKLLPYVDQWDHDCHFVDVLGWGFTQRIPGIDYGAAGKRAHLQAFINKVVFGNTDTDALRQQSSSCTKRHKKLVLVGASIGGAIAIDYYLHFPSDVHRIVLIDAQAFTDKPKPKLTNMVPALAKLGAFTLKANWLRTTAAKLSYHTEAFQNDVQIVQVGRLHTLCEYWLESTVSFINATGYCVSESVKDVDVETLVLWGRHDRVLPKGDEKRFEETLPKCTLRYIEDAGHSPHVERPGTIALMMEEFFDGL